MYNIHIHYIHILYTLCINNHNNIIRPLKHFTTLTYFYNVYYFIFVLAFMNKS